MRAKTIEVECIGSTHGNLLSELWYESDDDVKRKAASDRQQDVRWLQVCVPGMIAHAYTARIPLLAHGLTVKLRLCQCSHCSLAGRIAVCSCGYSKCNLQLAQARPG